MPQSCPTRMGSAAQPVAETLAEFTGSAEQPVAVQRGIGATMQSPETRIANDGRPYTRQQFEAHYGSRAESYWQRATPCSAVQPASTNTSAPAASVALPPAAQGSAGPPASSNVSDPDASAASPRAMQGSAAQPAEVAMEAVVPRQPVLFTWGHFMQLQHGTGQGGTAACTEQRRLRALCLEQGIYEIDISHGDYDWRQPLKSLPERKAQMLIGDGVVRFIFRLLRDVMDHNYVKKDPGERHVFQVICAIGD